MQYHASLGKGHTTGNSELTGDGTSGLDQSKMKGCACRKKKT